MNTRKMSVVAINGSERKNGNNVAVLSYAKQVLSERNIDLTVISLRELNMTPCGPCGDCNFRTTPCGVTDEVKSVVAQMATANGIIYATPVHGFGSAPLMPAFLERSGTGFLRFDRQLTNKVAGIIVTGRRYSHVETYSYLVNHALLNRMILVGSGFPSVLHGDAAGEVLQDEEGMEMVTRMLHRMADMMMLICEHRALTGRDGLATAIRSERERAEGEAAAPRDTIPALV